MVCDETALTDSERCRQMMFCRIVNLFSWMNQDATLSCMIVDTFIQSVNSETRISVARDMILLNEKISETGTLAAIYIAEISFPRHGMSAAAMRHDAFRNDFVLVDNSR